MSDPLVTTESDQLRYNTPQGLPLVVTFSDLTDAGNVVTGVSAFLWEHCDPHTIFRFNNDHLLDYRARRPMVAFRDGKIVDLQTEELVLTVASDQLGHQFLHLSGYEPDYRWEEFVDAILHIAEEFRVVHTTIFRSVALQVPHTRPTMLSVSGTREDVISEHPQWKPQYTQVGSISHLLEYRLQALDEDVIGCTTLVPAYLAGNRYPLGIVACLDALSKCTGLIFDTASVTEEADTYLEMVNQQVDENEENQALVREIEERFDQFNKSREAREELLGESGEIPSAEELAREFEHFLASADRRDLRDRGSDSSRGGDGSHGRDPGRGSDASRGGSQDGDVDPHPRDHSE